MMNVSKQKMSSGKKLAWYVVAKCSGRYMAGKLPSTQLETIILLNGVEYCLQVRGVICEYCMLYYTRIPMSLSNPFKYSD